MSQKPSCLLPDTVVPLRYTLHLRPNLESFTFQGHVRIDVITNQPTRSITLHAADLEITRCFALPGDETTMRVAAQITLDAKTETCTFVFAEELAAGHTALEIEYRGILNDKMAGFYRSRYTDGHGRERYLATTQFEACDARRALPCWDEPAHKARFSVTLTVRDGMTVLSNMPIKNRIVDGAGTQRISFVTSPLMSTYLLAFVVGEFDFIEQLMNNGTVVRVYTLPGQSEQGRFALTTAVRSLEFYNEYFGIPYPLPKLDLIAIPDFATSAMENWGLVTYRDSCLLIDSDDSSASTRQEVAITITHELAHQWFGNLVTMQWWNNLWLNEGFATFMSIIAVNVLFPEWDLFMQFIANEYSSALSIDSLRSTHAIEINVDHPDDINQIFDQISYEKGACILRMIHDFIGDEAFRTGLQRYLTHHAYRNAVTEDLWAALSDASGKPVAEMMNTWTKQPGYPLVTVHPDGTTSQQRFLASGAPLTHEERQQTWHIPLPPPSGAKLNRGQTALIRANYHPDQWLDLARAMEHKQLGPIDRYGLLYDALALTRAGHLNVEHLLRLLVASRTETNDIVWSLVLGAIGALDAITEETSLEKTFASFVRSVMRPITDKIGWAPQSDERHTRTLLRSGILGVMGSFGDPQIISQVKMRFAAHVRGTPIDPNLRSMVYGLVAQFGQETDYITLTERYHATSFQEERDRILYALGQFRDPTLIECTLTFAFDPETVRAGDIDTILSSVASHPEGRRRSWRFLKDNWEAISKRFDTGGNHMLQSIIASVCAGFADNHAAQDIEQFFAQHPTPSASRTITEAIERIRIRDAWYHRDHDRIAQFLTEHLG